MALSDDPKISTTIPYHARGCTVGNFSASLPDADREVLTAWLADPEVPHTAIAARVNSDPDYDVHFKPFTVGRHRRGECACGAL